jgi:hypothetical protein
MERHEVELSRVLEEHLAWHYARLECAKGMILGIVQAGSVQLHQIASKFCSAAKPDSRVKRFYRLIRFQNIDFKMICMAIMAILCLPGPLTLTLDRSNWQYGKNSLNFLVLAVVYQGISIPLLWVNLGREGNSDTAERKQLMQRLLRIIDASAVRCLLADREFIGEDWFKWLNENKIPFCIRIKGNTQIRHKNGGYVTVLSQIHHLAPGETRHWDAHKIWGVPVQLIAFKRENGDPVVLAATVGLSVDLLALYRKRWTIECLFKSLKSNGFSWEGSKITDPARSEKLFALVALAFAFTVKIGAIAANVIPIPVKKTLNRPLYNLFSYGLKYLKDARSIKHIPFKNVIYQCLIMRVNACVRY